MSSDGQLRVYDLRTPSSASNHLTHSIPIQASSSSSPSEALTHDWNRYRPSIIATAGVDRLIRTFDIRAGPQQGPVTVLAGHEYAVRKIGWSPHAADLLLSASYDMTCRVWVDGSSSNGEAMASDEAEGGKDSIGREVGRMGNHTEFVTGLDWCLFGAEGWCATCAWDERVLVWDVGAYMSS